jgi:hypothetical protein
MPQDHVLKWGPLWAVLMLVLCALGCKAPSSVDRSYAPGSEAYGGSGGGSYQTDADYDGILDTKDAEYYVEEERFSKEAPSGTPALDPSTEIPPATGEKVPPPSPEPDDQSAPSRGRQIIYTAGMGLSVFDVDDVMNKLEAIPDRHGGWLHQRYDNSVVLRVPAAKLELVIAEITEWGVVEWKTLEALDVTAEYTDLDSRIRVLEQMQKHLKELLARAKDVEQSLEIQVELSRITAELEQLRAQMRMLESSIAFSTLAVQLSERSTTQAEPSNDPFTWVDELGAEATAYR